jgi:hypothetical protein
MMDEFPDSDLIGDRIMQQSFVEHMSPQARKEYEEEQAQEKQFKGIEGQAEMVRRIEEKYPGKTLGPRGELIDKPKTEEEKVREGVKLKTLAEQEAYKAVYDEWVQMGSPTNIVPDRANPGKWKTIEPGAREQRAEGRRAAAETKRTETAQVKATEKETKRLKAEPWTAPDVAGETFQALQPQVQKKIWNAYVTALGKPRDIRSKRRVRFYEEKYGLSEEDLTTGATAKAPTEMSDEELKKALGA